MFVQFVLGGTLMAVCLTLHAIVLDRVAVVIRRLIADEHRPPASHTRFVLLTAAAVVTFVSHVVQIWIWAMAILAVGEFENLETALYFSTASFTTVGYGDVVASSDWRLLGSFEAAVGMLLFGLSTAFLFDVMRQVWRRAADGARTAA